MITNITKQVVEYLEDNTQLHIETIKSPVQQSDNGTTVIVPQKLFKAVDNKEDWWKIVEAKILPELGNYNYILSAELVKQMDKYYGIIFRSVSLDIPLKDLNAESELNEISEEESDEIRKHATEILRV